MMRVLSFLLVLSFAGMVACSPKTGSGTSDSGGKTYSEDLSGVRPKPQVKDTTKNTSGSVAGNLPVRKSTDYVEAKFAVNQQLDNVLDSISRVNLTTGFVDGFTIQLYSGLKREEALNVRKQLSTTLPDVESEVQYVQPNFRVRAGKYFDRFEANKDYIAIKKHFPNAIIIPERIPIN
jgi:hypothetical protein